MLSSLLVLTILGLPLLYISMYKLLIFIWIPKIKNLLFLIISGISSGFGRLSKKLLSVNLDLPMALYNDTRVALTFGNLK